MKNRIQELLCRSKGFILFSLLLTTAQAFAWSAISLGGGNWAIICANGTAWSYNGSSAGLDVVGPALCPAGIAAPTVPEGARVVKGIRQNIAMDLLRNCKELGDRNEPTLRSYPPHGYPCLGCAPCPGNPTEFCDINNLRIVIVSKSNQCKASNPNPNPNPNPLPLDFE